MTKFGLKSDSLRVRFCLEAARWSFLGFIFTLIVAIPCIWYASKIASERQVLIIAKTASRAFRQMILQDEVRDAQFQMRRALELKPGESAVVFGPDLKAIYPIDAADNSPACTTPLKVCWGTRLHSVSMLYPIFRDDEKQTSLYGYLQITVEPTLDRVTIIVFAVLLFATFIGQALGLSVTLIRSANQIGSVLSEWAEHLHKSPAVRPQEIKVPYRELDSMQKAVDGLHLEIAKLRDQSAREAKAEAQLGLLREISHDLKTPHALLRSSFALLSQPTTETRVVDTDNERRIESNLDRMGDLLRQVRLLPGSQSDSDDEPFDFMAETKAIVGDFLWDPEAQKKNVAIEFACRQDRVGRVKIPKLAYYRILDNLMRNAIEAVSAKGGRIFVDLTMENGQPILSVRDNGCGIDPKLRDQIFNFGFSTKETRGSGLGLGIVSKLCREYGASIFVESLPDEGSKFTIQFQNRPPERETTDLGLA